MAQITQLPAAQKKVVSRAKDAADAFSYIEGGIVSPVNDTLNELVGSELPKFYVKAVEGDTIVETVPSGARRPKGSVYYRRPDTGIGAIFTSYDDDKIYFSRDGERVVARDVAADGYEITHLYGFQALRFVYMTVADESMSAKVYQYDPLATTAISAFADYSGTVPGAVSATSTAHGLQTGMIVDIAGTTSYDGSVAITVIDADTFYFLGTWVATETGTVGGDVVRLLDAPGLATGGGVISQMENRILIFNTGTSLGVGQYSELDAGFNTLNFVSGTTTVSPGALSGGLIDVRASTFYNGMNYVFEPSRVTVHQVGADSQNLTTSVKDNDTINPEYSIDGYGTKSPNGVCTGRGLVFYADDNNGIFSYSPGKYGYKEVGGVELSESIHETITSYDLSAAAIAFHPIEDLLLVSCSSIKGGSNDTIFYYNFQTRGWSKDVSKFVSQFIWDEDEGQMYGVGSSVGDLYTIFDGTYEDAQGDGIDLRVRGRYFEGPRRSQLKEYIDSSVILGVPTLMESFNYSLYVNSETAPQSSTDVDVSDFSSPGVQTLAAGPWGATTAGGGSGADDANLNFVQYYNDDLIDDHRRVAVEITATPKSAFAVFAPEIVCEVIDETDDDFL